MLPQCWIHVYWLSSLMTYTTCKNCSHNNIEYQEWICRLCFSKWLKCKRCRFNGKGKVIRCRFWLLIESFLKTLSKVQHIVNKSVTAFKHKSLARKNYHIRITSSSLKSDFCKDFLLDFRVMYRLWYRYERKITFSKHFSFALHSLANIFTKTAIKE